MLKPTPEQEKIINESGNIVVTAKPGSGKTFTIIEKIKIISDSLLSYQGVIAISFTQKSSYELSIRSKRREIPKKKSFYGTIDGFCINEIIRPFSKHFTNQINLFEVKTTLNDYPIYKELKSLENVNEEVSQSNMDLLSQSLKEGHIFLDICGETALFILNNVPACLEYLKSRYTHIFIDEYQDCGEAQDAIFKKLVNAGIIGVAVGDLDQAIYAFSNRYSKFLSSLMSNPNFKHFKLTENRRCHKSISDYSLALMGISIDSIDYDYRM
ncbi:UvrD-helicase domain-containing protein [Methanolapillus africanus]|uniref:UvrD-helicase domain-containing protein n=1 Tax=Methanolapillus africanus TaxID=3028297 RepID=UPI0030B89B6D